MISIGPFSVQVVAVFLAILLAWAVARMVAKRLPDSPYKAAGGMPWHAHPCRPRKPRTLIHGTRCEVCQEERGNGAA